MQKFRNVYLRLRKWLVEFRYNNPILVQEMRSRLRGRKAFTHLFLYVLILGVIAAGVLILSAKAGRYMGLGFLFGGLGNDDAVLGKILFTTTMIVQSGLISLFVPAYSSGAIAAEREKGTFTLLAMTSMSSRSIVFQKMLATVAQSGLMQLASLPITSVALMFGGISPGEIILGYIGLLFRAASVSALGVFCSCTASNVRNATLVAYLIVFLTPSCIQGGFGMAFTMMPSPVSGGFNTLMQIGIMLYSFLVAVFWTFILQLLAAQKVERLRRSY